jgi:high-affinity Fe2+/Pb2+ permease
MRALGVITAVIALAFSLMFTFTIPQWGIINPFATHLSVFNRTASFTLYFIFDGAVLLALVWSSRRQARHPLKRREGRRT